MLLLIDHSLLYPVGCGFYSEAYFFVQTGMLFFNMVLDAILYTFIQ